jgi:hypothetical protein
MKIFRLAVITLIASSLAGPAFGKNENENSGNEDNNGKHTPNANSNAYNGKGKKAPEVATFANDLVAETHADDPGSPLDIVLKVIGTYRSDDTEGLDGLIEALGVSRLWFLSIISSEISSLSSCSLLLFLTISIISR